MTDPLDGLKRALSNRYLIQRELGAGGMAIVYLAEDLKHRRKVAVKVLRPGLAAALGTERFLREINVTANLNHPHILPLLDSGTAEEPPSARPPVRPSDQTPTALPPFSPTAVLYYVMPYVEGESLRDRLNREKQLPIDDALEIASEVADALGSAHRQGVVHRDIKPENILLSEGHAVVADFGIALAVSAAGGQRLTDTGLSVGTPEYMSPEQAAGEQSIDARSDVYSLACVLYEMLVGEPPFTGPTAQSIIAKRFSDPVPSVRRLRDTVPATIDAALIRALAKAPADRFAAVEELAEALVAGESEWAAPTDKSIVVLPFENLSPDPGNAFFADGLTEELIADLSNVAALKVISRTSAFAFKDTTKTVPSIARELNVRYALEGSVRRAGESLRITAQLIDAASDSHLWAEKYTGKLDNVFDFQESLSRKIVAVLKATLTAEDDRQLTNRPFEDVRAYDCYMRATQELWTFTEGAIDRIIQLTNEALEIVGDNALLYAALALAYWQYHNAGIRSDEDTLRQADAFADRALELQSDLPQAFVAKGMIAFTRADFRAAAQKLQRSIDLKPDTEALGQLAWLYAYYGKVDAARSMVDQAVGLDPLGHMTLGRRGFVELLSGNATDAQDWFDRAIEIAPDSLLWPLFRGIVAAYTGARGRAVSLFSHVAKRGSGLLRQIPELWRAALDGDNNEVQAAVAEFGDFAERDTELSWWITDCLACVGDRERALTWLDNTIDRGFVNHQFFAEIDPFMEPLRVHPRFQALIERARELQGTFYA